MTTTLKQTVTLLTIVLAFFIISNTSAQDIIYRTDGTAINATVTEVGDEDIKYVLSSAGNKVVFTLDLAKIEKVVFADGRVENFETNIYAPTPQVFQRKNAMKMSFMGLLYGHTSIHYERRMTPGQSYEISTRIIGLGKNRDLNFGLNQDKRNARGLGVAMGYKFIKTPAQYKKGLRPSHLMRGTYLKPTLEGGYYGENYIADNSGNNEQTVINFSEPTLKRRNVGYYALMLGIGKQSVFSNRFLVDINFGIGIAGDSAKGNYNTYFHNNFGHARFGEGLGLALSGGLRIGYLF
jgi:hypothetical protein